MRKILLVALAALLQACSVYQLPGQQSGRQPEHPREIPEHNEQSKQQPPPGSENPAPQTSVETSPPSDEPPVTAAYTPLLAKADVATQRGDYEQALALLERAQRIDPDNAQIYLALARTHSERGDARQAAATAQRGLLYCTSSEQCDDLRNYLY